MAKEWATAVELAQEVRAGETTGAELVDAAIARLEQAADLNLLVSDRFDAALEEARTQSPDDGPFRGVPLLIKDLGCTMQGGVDYMGSALLKRQGARAAADCALTKRLKRAGFIILGRTTTPEFGIRSTTESRATGATRNPWSLNHSTGGSSGGSAAAVAGGLVPIAEGSDGGGSLRMPASLCGCVALKPSRGRISQAPDGEAMMGHNEYGPLARSIGDVAAFLDVASGPEPGDPVTPPSPARSFSTEAELDPSPLRIGVFLGSQLAATAIDRSCTEAVRLVADRLATAGHDVIDDAPAAYTDEEYLDHFIDTIAPSLGGLFDHVAEVVGRPLTEDDVEPQTWYWFSRGARRTGSELANDLTWLADYRRRMAAWWSSGWDLLVAPAFPRAALELGMSDDGAEQTRRNIDLIRLTAPINSTGQPALAVPALIADGLPIGVQIVGAYGREDLLLQVGRQLEAVTRWRDWHPARGKPQLQPMADPESPPVL